MLKTSHIRHTQKTWRNKLVLAGKHFPCWLPFIVLCRLLEEKSPAMNSESYNNNNTGKISPSVIVAYLGVISCFQIGFKAYYLGENTCCVL